MPTRVSRMNDINDEYFLLIGNYEFSESEEFIHMSPSSLTMRNREALYDGTWDGRPVEYILDAIGLDKPHRDKEILEDDFILDPIMGLLIADKHREFFMTVGKQTDFKFH